MSRKIVQVEIASGYVVALCDDGSLWKLEIAEIPFAEINEFKAEAVDEPDF